MTEIQSGPGEPRQVGRKATRKFNCAISGREYPRRDLMSLEEVRPSLAELIRADHPGLSLDALISRAELSQYRTRYVEELLKAEHGELTELDRQVAESLATHETLAENIDEAFEDRRTVGERLSDRVATFGGSWFFLILFSVTLAMWMVFNLAVPLSDQFDGYPFLLLNLVLSCLAAFQAPVIMMSSESTGIQGPAGVAERLPCQPQGRARDTAPAREARPPDIAAMAAARRNPTDAARDHAGDDARRSPAIVHAASRLHLVRRPGAPERAMNRTQAAQFRHRPSRH